MKMRAIGISIFLATMIMNLAYSQEVTPVSLGAQQIDQLKAGKLLIKLNTQSARIKHRMDNNQKSKAKSLMDEMEKEQNEIINAFIDHYTFSNFYFFYSDDSDKVLRERKFDSLFKEKGKPISDIPALSNTFVLVLGVAPGYSTVDKYKFVLHQLTADGLSPIDKTMPKVFKTQSKKLFSNKYDFPNSVKRMVERLEKFHIKIQE